MDVLEANIPPFAADKSFWVSLWRLASTAEEKRYIDKLMANQRQNHETIHKVDNYLRDIKRRGLLVENPQYSLALIRHEITIPFLPFERLIIKSNDQTLGAISLLCWNHSQSHFECWVPSEEENVPEVHDYSFGEPKYERFESILQRHLDEGWVLESRREVGGHWSERD